jgi:excisionase family DNA binding protein
LAKEVLLYPPPGPWRIVLPDGLELLAPQQEGTGGGLLSVDQAAELLGLGKTAAKRLITIGTLPSIKFGRRRLVPAAAIERLIAAAIEKGSS